MYRDHIRLFYGTVGEADRAGYNEYPKDKFPKKSGLLYGYTGLRGDAKDLYWNIKKGKEKRIKLIKCESYLEQRKYVMEADKVIWACGY